MTEERIKLVEPILNTFDNEDIKEFAPQRNLFKKYGIESEE